MDPAEARRIMGPDAIIGLSTHSREQIEAAAEQPVDYISVGPIWETPTKEGRPATGLELIRTAAEIAAGPGSRSAASTPRTSDEVVAAGAERLCVVRAIRDADDPARRRPRRCSTRSIRPPERRAEPMMAGARERKRAERQKRKRRSAERTRAPVEASAEPSERLAESNGRARPPRASRRRWRGATRSGTRRRGAKLEPLEQGERPTAVTVGAIVSAVLAIVFTVSAVLADRRRGRRRPRHQARPDRRLRRSSSGSMAMGMWKARYWAVLGFQTVLLLVMLASAFGLVVVNSVPQAVGTTLLLLRVGNALLFHDPRDGADPDAVPRRRLAD